MNLDVICHRAQSWVGWSIRSRPKQYSTYLSVIARSASNEANSDNLYHLCEPFALCHSEGVERAKNLAQDKLREAISVGKGWCAPQRGYYPQGSQANMPHGDVKTIGNYTLIVSTSNGGER